MNIRQAISTATQALEVAGVPDPATDAGLLLSHLTGLSRLDAQLCGAQPLTYEQEQRFASLLLSRTLREPLQYLLGTQCFYGLDFVVDTRVLIPRQETETLCELGLAHLLALAAPTALDLCTGSGAIAITLKHECPAAAVTAADLSADALTVAALNAKQNEADIRLVQGDLFAPVAGQRFDLIVSNPPYVPSGDCATLQPEVEHEPRMALDGGADGLCFYRRIALAAHAHLSSRGLLAMEVGDHQAQAVAELLSQTDHYRDIAITKDLYGALRVVSAHALSTPT
ncbi:MAG: peptide chain release factor N(5)-glutamine methyltransferase [Clostridia bacterium]